MAENEEPAEEELSEEEIQAAVERAAKKKKLIMLGAIGLVLLLVAGGGTVLALKFLGSDETTEPVAEVKPEGEAEAAPQAEEHKDKTAFYDALDPAFLANFMVGGRQHYLQISLTVMAREEDALTTMRTHMPLVRNRIVMLLSGESFENLQTDEGRVQLQKKLLTAIQEIMTKEAGKPLIEQIFFTNFVMQ